jgi:predicted dehydrogenase
MRFHPLVGVLRDRVAAGAIGDVLAFTHHVGQYLPDWHPWEDYRRFYAAKRETSATREIVPFELGWLTYLLGPLAEVSCFKAKVSALEVDIDDIYAALLRFGSGVRGQLTVEVLSRPGLRQARLVGSEGTLVWDWQARVVREHRAGSEGFEEHHEPPPIEGPGGAWVAENMYIAEMAGYVAAIEGADSWPYSVAEDIELLAVLRALERSADEGRHIEVGSRA